MVPEAAGRQGARDPQGLVRPLRRCGIPTMLPTIEMEGAVLNPGIVAGEAGAARLAFLELSLVGSRLRRHCLRSEVLRGRHGRGPAVRVGHQESAFQRLIGRRQPGAQRGPWSR